MTKSHKQQDEERRAADEGRAIRAGQLFRIGWVYDVYRCGPLYFATLAEAEERRDKMIREQEKPIPDDYYERQAHLKKLDVWVEQYLERAWRRVDGSERSCVFGVAYAD